MPIAALVFFALINDPTVIWLNDHQIKTLLVGKRFSRAMNGYIVNRESFEILYADGAYRHYSDDGRAVGTYKITGDTFCVFTSVASVNRCRKIGRRGFQTIMHDNTSNIDYEIVFR